MWRYAPLLPWRTRRRHHARRGADHVAAVAKDRPPLGAGPLFIKDESKNPTRSFKSRGMAVAVSMAEALGATSLATPTAGNAGCALAAYGARAGLPVFVAMPDDTPQSIMDEAREYGAEVAVVKWRDHSGGETGTGACRGTRLIRPVHTQRAISCRRQKNHGL